jgi:hypothetical protein
MALMSDLVLLGIVILVLLVCYLNLKNDGDDDDWPEI